MLVTQCLIVFNLIATRYKLLLAELVKQTDESHPDYPNITRALALVGEVAMYINDAIRQRQNRYADLLVPSEPFLLQSDLIGLTV